MWCEGESAYVRDREGGSMINQRRGGSLILSEGRYVDDEEEEEEEDDDEVEGGIEVDKGREAPGGGAEDVEQHDAG